MFSGIMPLTLTSVKKWARHLFLNKITLKIHMPHTQTAPFSDGDILAYSDGPTALFKVALVQPDEVCGRHAYYGIHCLGGIHYAVHRDCRLATPDEVLTYKTLISKLNEKQKASNEDVDANIAECRRIATEHDSQAVVVMRIERDGTINLSTYGDTKHKCDVIGEWAHKSIGSQYSRIPFEPVFGWGNNGSPKHLELREYMSLSPAGKAYYDRVAGTVNGLPITKT